MTGPSYIGGKRGRGHRPGVALVIEQQPRDVSPQIAMQYLLSQEAEGDVLDVIP
jgi:hypothetical protein